MTEEEYRCVKVEQIITGNVDFVYCSKHEEEYDKTVKEQENFVDFDLTDEYLMQEHPYYALDTEVAYD